ncbi:hypothetical protein [Actinosynnema sp. NPDC020468]|uniref:hypothetical protein n=1 Tax=Actinosynnema sp. NPDC020468 TaxID=3154488 RepID=UPI0033FADF6F
MIVGSTWVDGPNIQFGSRDGGDAVVAGPDYRLDRLTPRPRLAWAPKPCRTPEYLLDARHEVVPYHHRPQAQDRLVSWLDEPDALSALVVRGGVGTGKTRLVNAFAGVAHLSGWTVVRAACEGSPPAWPSPRFGSSERVLVGVAQPERWDRATLYRMVSALPAHFPGATVRVLVPSRFGCDAGVAEVVLDGVVDRDRAFVEAVHAFQIALELVPRDVRVPDLSGCSTVLAVHVMALAAVLGG